MLNGYKYAVIRVKNTLEKMGGYTRYNKLKNKVEKYSLDYDCSEKEAEDKVIGKNELFTSTTCTNSLVVGVTRLVFILIQQM